MSSVLAPEKVRNVIPLLSPRLNFAGSKCLIMESPTMTVFAETLPFRRCSFSFCLPDSSEWSRFSLFPLRLGFLTLEGPVVPESCIGEFDCSTLGSTRIGESFLVLNTE